MLRPNQISSIFSFGPLELNEINVEIKIARVTISINPLPPPQILRTLINVYNVLLKVESHTSYNFTLDLIYQEIVDTDDCVHNHCVEGSTCVDLPFRYSCVCPEGTSGRYCEGI